MWHEGTAPRFCIRPKNITPKPTTRESGADTTMANGPLLQITCNPNSPAKPTVYGSPAKAFSKKQVQKVDSISSFDRLMQKAADEEEAAKRAEEEEEAGGEGEEDDGLSGAAVHSYKKSQFWSKEVEEKLGLAGADPYGLLELEDRRWKATPEEIRKSYRRLVLTKHPDKKAGEAIQKAKSAVDVTDESKDKDKENGGEEGDEQEEEEEEDSEFKLLSAAWELLGSNETRRAYDSIDNFNDYLPVAFNPKKTSGRGFFATFAPGFARQSKFCTEGKVVPPQLGDAETPYEQVAKFYKFWTSFPSWRTFDLLAEHDLKEAEDREERRWMQRQNKNYTDKIKKEERQRVLAFVQLAYDNDPRVIAHKDRLAAEKAAAKEAKESAVKAKKDAEEQAKRQVEEEKKAKLAAEEAAKNAEKAAGADSKREKERLRSALKKVRDAHAHARPTAAKLPRAAASCRELPRERPWLFHGCVCMHAHARRAVHAAACACMRMRGGPCMRAPPVRTPQLVQFQAPQVLGPPFVSAQGGRPLV